MNAASCLAFLKQHQPEIILMDINLPDMNGTELCKIVKQQYPQVRILGLSTFNQQAVIKNMIDSGASGYVLKNATGEELCEAITAAMSGKNYLSREAAFAMEESDRKLPQITFREKEVLKFLVEGLTNQQIAEKLFISISTVATHRQSLLNKFEVKNTASLLKFASKFGLMN
jgi:DNA-binding NarL/FixJ family response regulator